MIYHLRLDGELEKQIKELAEIQDGGNVEEFLKRLCIQVATPEIFDAMENGMNVEYGKVDDKFRNGKAME